ATVDPTGNVATWNYEVWSGSHSTRPGGAGNLAAGWMVESAFEQPVPKPVPLPAGDGDRNAIPLYRFAEPRVVYHFIESMPIRVSALRGLGAYANVFSIESFMDELARKAGVDPVVYRRRQLADPRARDAIDTAAFRFNWAGWE